MLETFNWVYDASSDMSATIADSVVEYEEFNACDEEEEDNEVRACWREQRPGDAGKMGKRLGLEVEMMRVSFRRRELVELS